jgi:hypothetical protein
VSMCPCSLILEIGQYARRIKCETAVPYQIHHLAAVGKVLTYMEIPRQQLGHIYHDRSYEAQQQRLNKDAVWETVNTHSNAIIIFLLLQRYGLSNLHNF